MICSAGSRRCIAASGSRPSMAAVEPFKSANSTVTLLRSPSPARRCTGCRAAACSLGGAGLTVATSDLPQPAQKRSPGALTNLHDGHVRVSDDPQAVQKRPPDLLSVLQ